MSNEIRPVPRSTHHRPALLLRPRRGTRTSLRICRGPGLGAIAAPRCPSCRDFDALVAPHVDAMERVARSVVRCHGLAADVVQTVLLRLWRKNARIAGDPRPFLCHLAFLGALQELRGRRRREAHERAACDAHAHGGGEPDPFRSAQQDEWNAAIRGALDTLPAPQRIVFQLFELEGHDYGCVAEQIGVPVGTVRSRLFRARAALRARLRHLLGELGPMDESSSIDRTAPHSKRSAARKLPSFEIPGMVAPGARSGPF
ncbi:MAG: sigma-70 family RNA polymerase sigma factor [Planctomycetaceae bacterium]|nr:sigma-70 family RNA polymerase sigma factor [Planctomycetaceae bacterium]